MFNLVRWYNQNRGRLWLTVAIILGVIFFTQVANNFYKKQTPNTPSKMPINVQEGINNEISGKLEGTSSLVGGSSVSGNNLKEQVKVIDNFIKYCNDGKVQEAYELLTDECKEELFLNLETFKIKYYDKVFDTKKTYNVQNWMGNTYKVKLMEDALSTGNVSDNSAHFQEYMTVIKKSQGYQLSINNYIGKANIDRITTNKGITINMLVKNTYMDYSEYTLKIQNNTENTILLDNGRKTKGIYLLDKNNVEEYANTGEIAYEDLKLLSGQTKTYTFKFSNNYSNTREMEYLVFENVIMNYEEYDNTIDKNNYNGFTKITANI